MRREAQEWDVLAWSSAFPYLGFWWTKGVSFFLYIIIAPLNKQILIIFLVLIRGFRYYATHQYFLSKRSLYLVVWRIDDGKNGLIEVLQWLGNIQARAPNSPVIIVGTHHDDIGTKISENEVFTLQQYIRERFIAVTDAEKIGLPKVMSSIEISCK